MSLDVEAVRFRVEQRDDRALSSYYFEFDPTGDADIDLVLGAVALAGKMFHSTDFWGDDDTFDDGSSLIDAIQVAANEAARLRREP